MFKLMQTALITQHTYIVNILITKLSEIPLWYKNTSRYTPGNCNKLYVSHFSHLQYSEDCDRMISRVNQINGT